MDKTVQLLVDKQYCERELMGRIHLTSRIKLGVGDALGGEINDSFKTSDLGPRFSTLESAVST